MYDCRIVPAMWSKGITTSIPKPSTSDHRDPIPFQGLNFGSSSIYDNVQSCAIDIYLYITYIYLNCLLPLFADTMVYI